MERRVRILVTLGMIAALAGLMLISVEPEVDLSVDQLMESPETRHTELQSRTRSINDSE